MPLDDVRVLDAATFVAAPFAATCLAEFGAEVIKIERPGAGDELRRLGTPSEAGDTYWWFNDARNKKCITLNLKDARGAALFRRLAATADVVIENFRPGTMERWGLGFADLLAVNPRLVMLRISAYGQTGPKSGLPGFARLAQAMDRPELAGDERFRLKRSRLERRDEVNAMVRAWTSLHDRETIIRRCSDGEVPCGPVCSIEDIFNEEQFWVRDTLVRVTDPRIGDVALQGTIPKLSDTPGGIRHLGTVLAAHNEAIYGEELGLTSEELAALSEAGVV